MTESIVLNVSGMMCGGCEANVSNRLQALPGVNSVAASSKDKQVRIEFDAAQTDRDTLIKMITDAGFVVES